MDQHRGGEKSGFEEIKIIVCREGLEKWSIFSSKLDERLQNQEMIVPSSAESGEANK